MPNLHFQKGSALPTQTGCEPELGHTKVRRTEPMDRPRHGAKSYSILLTAGWVLTPDGFGSRAQNIQLEDAERRHQERPWMLMRDQAGTPWWDRPGTPVAPAWEGSSTFTPAPLAQKPPSTHRSCAAPWLPAEGGH